MGRRCGAASVWSQSYERFHSFSLYQLEVPCGVATRPTGK